MNEHHLPHVERTWTIGTVLASTGSLITTLALRARLPSDFKVRQSRSQGLESW
jgi:hypothetical protein